MTDARHIEAAASQMGIDYGQALSAIYRSEVEQPHLLDEAVAYTDWPMPAAFHWDAPVSLPWWRRVWVWLVGEAE